MPTPITWDATGKRFYELGVDHGILFPMKDDGTYDEGIAWDGLISVENNPDGAEPNDLWADNIKYAVLRSTETLSLTIEAYQFPKEFNPCNGAVEAAPGVYVHQQKRKPFGLCYRSQIGNDTSSENDDGYKLHFVYGCTAQPSSETHETINDNPDAQTMSWDVDTLPVNYAGGKPCSELTVDSRYADETKLNALITILIGTAQTASRLPLPEEIITMMT